MPSPTMSNDDLRPSAAPATKDASELRAPSGVRRPSSAQVQLLFIGGYVVAAAAIAPFASTALHRTPAFLPAQLAAVFVEALLTALLLFQRFHLSGGLRLAGLGSAYLLHASFAVAYGLAFGRSVSNVVLPGSLDSTPVWVWLAWHTLFPVAVAAGLWPRRSSRSRPAGALDHADTPDAPDGPVLPMSFGTATAPSSPELPRWTKIWIGAGAALATVAVTTAVIVAAGPHLPTLVVGTRYSGTTHAIDAAVLAVNLLAAGLALAWSRHLGAVVRWAALAVTASIFDVLFALLSDQRYSLGWYLSRTGDIVVASVVLVALVHEVGRLYRRLLDQHRQLAERATHDPLTGVLTRAAILDLLDAAHLEHTALGGEARRGADAVARTPYSVAMADLDHFKEVNDRYGHLVGDQVLAEAAARARRALRAADSIGRYGGEEFLVVLPHCRLEQAVEVAERVRSAVSSTPIATTAGDITMTLSIGVADAEPGTTAVGTVDRADQALYRAKEAGRDRCAAATPSLRPR
ncbi:MAG: sensor domain-containing diguanylate cyclase [Actinomycetota bacterium]|nr:sensor domain-containing diguanylate cyclase [Actinomycetota bacterium]